MPTFSRSLRAGFLLFAASTVLVATAQTFPDKPIRVIVPFAPGGLVDGSMRTLAPRMSEALGQPIVIENRSGAGGVIGMADVARSPADGFTPLFGIESTALAPHIYKSPDYVHIPYKGAGPALTDFIAGQTQIFAVSTSLSLPQVRAGKARALAVAASRRAANMPDVPTTAESGFAGLEFSTWMGLLGPAGLPATVVARIRDAALHAIGDPANAKRFGDQGLDIHGSTPEAFSRFIATESAKFGRAAALAGIKPE